MNIKPILFSTPMVQANLDGNKTQTRRVIKPQPSIKMGVGKWIKNSIVQMLGDEELVIDYMLKHSQYSVGDILWVRETWNELNGEFAYKASPELFAKTYWFTEIKKAFNTVSLEIPIPEKCIKWKPSLFMPKEACRIFLKITNVQVERLQDISEDDAVKEGIEPTGNMSMFNKFYKNYLPIGYTDLKQIPSFQSLWQSINGEQSWNDNPFVWVIEFKRCEAPSNFLIK